MKNIWKIIFSSLFAFWLVLPNHFGQLKIDLMTQPLDWSNEMANGNLHIQFLDKLGIAVHSNFTADVSQQSDFERKFNTTQFGTELRFFPWGAKNIRLLKQLAPWEKIQKKEKAIGCIHFQKKKPPFFQGLYLAGDYQYEKTNLEFIPNSDLASPIADFPFVIESHGFGIGAGYLIRIGNLTLGVNYDFVFSKPKWEGPMDIFGDSLYTTTYPVKFRLTQGLQLEIGINL